MLVKGSLQFLDNRAEFVIRNTDGPAAQFTDTVFQAPAHNLICNHPPNSRRLRYGKLGIAWTVVVVLGPFWISGSSAVALYSSFLTSGGF